MDQANIELAREMGQALQVRKAADRVEGNLSKRMGPAAGARTKDALLGEFVPRMIRLLARLATRDNPEAVMQIARVLPLRIEVLTVAALNALGTMSTFSARDELLRWVILHERVKPDTARAALPGHAALAAFDARNPVPPRVLDAARDLSAQMTKSEKPANAATVLASLVAVAGIVYRLWSTREWGLQKTAIVLFSLLLVVPGLAVLIVTSIRESTQIRKAAARCGFGKAEFRTVFCGLNNGYPPAAREEAREGRADAGARDVLRCANCSVALRPFALPKGPWTGSMNEFWSLPKIEQDHGLVCEKCKCVICPVCSGEKASKLGLKEFVCTQCGHRPLKTIYRES